ncbi:MAG: hypothetical protein JJ896_01945 [Rhodothermales bacterium]|nr:hypothetical protein [Rhodothermales bacterium]MBO6778390.1 hypothetical protein [Rhodothermales bacterium]
MSSTWAAPEEHLLEAEAELESASTAFETAVRAELRAWAAAVRSQVVRPFGRMTADVSGSHDSLKTALHAQIAEIPPDDGLAAERMWDAVRLYVDQVHQQVMDPVLDYYRDSDPISRLESVAERARTRLYKAVDRLPESVELPTAQDLLHGQAGDSLMMRWRKSAQRGRRAARGAARSVSNSVGGVFGRTPAMLAHASRRVAPQEVARARLDNDVLPRIEAHTRSLRQWLEAEVRQQERILWEWTVGALRFLADHDQPKFHVPHSVRLKWPDIKGQDQSVPVRPGFAEALNLPAPAPPEVNEPDPTEALEGLRRDFTKAGTFLYGSVAPLASITRRSGTSAAFTRDRVVLAESLLDLRDLVRKTEEGLLKEIGHQALSPLERTYDAVRDRLKALELEARTLIAEHSADPRRLADELESLLGQTGEIAAVYRDLPGLSSSDRALTDAGESAWRGMMKDIAALPRDLRLRSVVGEKPVTHTTDLMQVARGAFERSLSARLEPTAEPLRKAIARVWNQTEQVQEVIVNTVHTALQQVTATDADSAGGDLPEEEAPDLATLISSGLDRAALSLEERYQSLGPEWAAFVTQLHRLLSDDWNSAFRAVQSDDFLAKRLLGLQTSISRRSERSWKRVTQAWSSGRERGMAAFRLARQRGRDLIRIGQTAVGVSTATTAERHLALDTVASARELYARLPLVYRRLFSPEPVADPGLAENRAGDLKEVGGLLDRWAQDLGSGIIVVDAPLGAGRTSFLRLLDIELRDDFHTLRIALDRRQTTEAELAGLFAEALFPDLPFRGDFAQLESLIRERIEINSTVVMVDNLEMLMFNISGGTALLNQLLLFWIRTDDRVAWVASCGSLAWRFAQKTAPAASRLAMSHPLSRWSAPTMEELILKRHRRSGVTLEFQPPEDPSPLTRQRLRRARTPQDVQRILSTDFFDALYRISGQSPTRALFEWIRAGEFSEAGDVLRLHPIKPLSFTYLAQVENDTAFTIRSLVFHNVMTVEEHATLFRTNEATAIMAFETLLSAGLIETLDAVDTAAIMPGVRYRIRRLVLEPVVRSLRERHFVY